MLMHDLQVKQLTPNSSLKFYHGYHNTAESRWHLIACLIPGYFVAYFRTQMHIAENRLTLPT